MVVRSLWRFAKQIHPLTSTTLHRSAATCLWCFCVVCVVVGLAIGVGNSFALCLYGGGDGGCGGDFVVVDLAVGVASSVVVIWLFFHLLTYLISFSPISHVQNPLSSHNIPNPERRKKKPERKKTKPNRHTNKLGRRKKNQVPDRITTSISTLFTAKDFIAHNRQNTTTPFRVPRPTINSDVEEISSTQVDPNSRNRHVRWSDAMDSCMITTLLHQELVGHKRNDNGFSSFHVSKAIESVHNRC
ncbi:uncharacterized protein LOC111398026 [Olea europaea var. sylvestris]|uniref:uncharacterized protein LOC111398026 n=1 Tax=Olea europaea var. sylvestris TaxID=158386 RepID=UPI000C1CE987|nr:uncharacterized protein LOC111398026 [Olea europaea var. sylvestris]